MTGSIDFDDLAYVTIQTNISSIYSIFYWATITDDAKKISIVNTILNNTIDITDKFLDLTYVLNISVKK
jgi:hypothetical protein